jgi:hypothetical protein
MKKRELYFSFLTQAKTNENFNERKNRPPAAIGELDAISIKNLLFFAIF